MKKALFISIIYFLTTGLSSLECKAQIGQPWIHDPSTLAFCDGKWYTFGTGAGGHRLLDRTGRQ